MVRPRLVGAYVWLFITVSAVNQVGASEERVHVSGAEPQPTQQTDDADTGRVLSLLQATSALEETMKAYPSMDWANHRAEHAKVDPAPAPALLAADSAVPKRGKPWGIGKPGQGDDSSQLSQDEWFDSMLQKEVEQKKQVPPLSSDQEEQVTSLVELRRSGLQFGLSSSMTMIPTFPQAQLESGVNRLLGKLGVLGEGKPMPCQGLVPKMCKPCPLGGPPKFCKGAKLECGAIFCSPMCRVILLKCKAKFGSLPESNDDQYGKALCSQYIAAGCSKILKCCAEDKDLYDFVENGGFYKRFPDPYFPSESCIEGPDPKLCAKCKAAVKVKMSVGKCSFPKIQPYKASDASTAFANRVCSPEPKKFPGCPAHKSFQERCESLRVKVKAKIGAMSAKFTANACKCMGCCKGACPYPLTYPFTPGGKPLLGPPP